MGGEIDHVVVECSGMAQVSSSRMSQDALELGWILFHWLTLQVLVFHLATDTHHNDIEEIYFMFDASLAAS